MARMRAVNEVRLHIAARAPEARWVCGRSVVREQGKRGYRPNAVVRIGSERHAIVVKLQAQQVPREVGMLAAHMARHHAVAAFCRPAPRRLLERFATEYHWPKLIVCEIPGPD